MLIAHLIAYHRPGRRPLSISDTVQDALRCARRYEFSKYRRGSAGWRSKDQLKRPREPIIPKRLNVLADPRIQSRSRAVLPHQQVVWTFRMWRWVRVDWQKIGGRGRGGKWRFFLFFTLCRTFNLIQLHLTANELLVHTVPL